MAHSFAPRTPKSSESVSIPSTAIKVGGRIGRFGLSVSERRRKTFSRAYGVLDEKEGVGLRATFIINPAGDDNYLVVSHTNVGRSVEETLRV